MNSPPNQEEKEVVVVSRFGGSSSDSKKKRERKKRFAKKQLPISEEQTYDGSTPLPKVTQERYVEGILSGLAKGPAYAAAGYKSKSPSSHAIQLTRNSRVATRLSYRLGELQAQMQAETGLTERKVVEELAKCAFSNMQDFVTSDEDGNIIFRDLEGLSREQMAAVESVKITKQTTTNKRGDKDYQTTHTQFKLHSKPGTLEQLGKHLGIFKEDNNQRRDVPLIIVIGADAENDRKPVENTADSN